MGDYQLPPLEYLMQADMVSGPSRDEMNASGSGLERKLADFGVNGKIRQAHPGPIVTMFEFEPAPGVKINRIVSLSDDLALSLRAPEHPRLSDSRQGNHRHRGAEPGPCNGRVA